MTDFKSHTLEVAGCKVAVLRGGAGSPVLFLHDGGGGGGGQRLRFLDALAADHDVIAPDHPGFGASETPDWLAGVDDLGHFYREFIETLGLDGVHVIGSSLGGWIALEMAVCCTHGLASLTLAAPAGVHFKGVTKADMFIVAQDEAVRLLFHDQALAEAELSRRGGLGEDQTAVLHKNRAATARLVWQPYFYRRALKTWLRRIDVPTRIVWGDQDRLFPPEHAEPLRALIPGARLTMIPQCGHLPHLEAPEALLDCVRALIEETAR